jgi:uncharacterized protein involved in exopolysaccharide biosynthesis
MSDEENEEAQQSGGGLSAEVIRSYASFAASAVRARWLLFTSIFAGFSIVAIVAASIWPRSYHCEASLMAQINQVAFQDNRQPEGLRGAYEVITRRDNIEAIVRKTNLVERWEATRPPILKLKDKVMGALRGSPSKVDQERMLIGTLQSGLGVTVGQGTLVLSLDWPDAETSAIIVDAAMQSFLEARHVAEISTIADYISILEGHAEKSRSDIDAYASQLRSIKDSRLSKLVDQQASAVETATPDAPAPVRVAPRPPSGPSETDVEKLMELKAELDVKQKALEAMEDQRARKLAELQGQLTEMSSKYTEAHPVMADLHKKIATYSQESPQSVALRGEIASLKQQVSGRAAPSAAGGGGAIAAMPGSGARAAANAEPLPADVMRLLQEGTEGVDPAIDAQFRNAVDKYAGLRSQISSSRVELDTAQAAFKHRYQIVAPAEKPNRPTKPKVPIIIAGGVIVGLLIGLGLCIWGELRSDRLVATWQVHAIGLPVLGKLRLPSGSAD